MKHVALFVLALTPSLARGCEPQSEPATMDQLIASSKYVFMAEVQSAVIVDDRWLEVRFTDVVSYKDEAPPFTLAKTPSSGAACGLSVTVPSKHWFFTDEDGYFYEGGGSQSVGTPEGTRLFKKVFPKFRKMLRDKADKMREDAG